MAGLTVDALVLGQKQQKLFLFSMNSGDLNRICYVTPRTHDDPEEIQRILKPRRGKQIAEYIKEPNTLLPTAIVVSLEDDVSVQQTADQKRVTLSFPSEEGKFAYVLDGQHRLEGFKQSGPIQFDLPVVALHQADEATRAKVFADINSKQETITDVHILELYYQIKDLTKDETALVDVIHSLNKAADSPLKGKVKVLDDDKGTWIKNTILKRFLTRAIPQSGIGVKPTGQQSAILKEYLKAVRSTWQDAWENRKEYSLSSSIGFEVMLGVFPVVKHRVDLLYGKEYKEETFAQALEPLKDAPIEVEVPGGGSAKLVIDWSKKKTNYLRNQRGRSLLINQFTRVLHQADEEAEGQEQSSE